ncbi:carbohydrate ABC transporter permease [Frondihabitans australicus]|uniref:Carbohydrate ABC transporter membrane protein 2 (CUT1 family) n=1 Tax=Frondihabitans australicus TaxID=386892 RepID=A0A495IGY4_9MICO|nr:carbohydrate ABC transporter permease [Frondihabitans australicus]RKR75273.1 carbohydrate ABC transporter membrane protein 2 (CUT1 family) [Frondihabitans australicus]
MRITAREKVVSYVVLTVFAVFAILPLIGVLFSSVLPASANDGGFHVPTTFAFGNYLAAWTQGHFAAYLLSSVLVTVSVVILTILLSVLAGFAFARLSFIGTNIIFFVLLAGLMLPAEAFIIPLYFDLRGADLTDTYASLILPQTAQSLAFGVFWMRNQFRLFPSDVIEAARLDGASDLRVLWRVIVPPSVPAIATMSVLVAMWTWNEFLTPLVMITTDSRRTAPLGLAFFQGEHTTNYSLLSAAGVLVALPIVVLYFVLQRRFINGMVGGISSR